MLSMKSSRVSEGTGPEWAQKGTPDPETVASGHALDPLVTALGLALVRQAGQAGPDRQR